MLACVGRVCVCVGLEGRGKLVMGRAVGAGVCVGGGGWGGYACVFQWKWEGGQVCVCVGGGGGGGMHACMCVSVEVGGWACMHVCGGGGGGVYACVWGRGRQVEKQRHQPPLPDPPLPDPPVPDPPQAKILREQHPEMSRGHVDTALVDHNLGCLLDGAGQVGLAGWWRGEGDHPQQLSGCAGQVFWMFLGDVCTCVWVGDEGHIR